MEADGEGFLYPHLNPLECIDCHQCEKVCPVLNNKTEKNPALPQAWAVWNADEKVRLASSSGGFFSLLAEDVLNRNGTVYGATVVDKVVKHIRIEDREGIASLRGSKYVQSEIGTSYLDAEADLKAGKWVLFTGTPCQIEGLKLFLKKTYERLICMDFICHGVPSPSIWERYVKLRESQAGSTMTQAAFRDKRNGWKSYELSLEFANGSTYHQNHSKDPFVRSFLWDFTLRPSCYQCRFKKWNRVSDITAADFWGIDQMLPQMADDRGTSLVLIHSEKGEKSFQKLIVKMQCQQVDAQQAIAYNPSMVHSAKRPEMRNEFFTEKVFREGFAECVERYAKEPLSIKIIIKKALVKLGLLELVKRLKQKD